MHKQFRELLDKATGISQHIIALVIDIRGFTAFSQRESLDVANYVKKVYMKMIDSYFSNASFYKPTGDGLLIIISCPEEKLKEVVDNTIKTCLKLLEDFGNLCTGEAIINFPTPNKIGIGITRGSACCITSDGKILDYSGRVLNLASRLMDIARPSGIVFDSSLGFDLLPNETKKLFLKEDNAFIRGVAEEEPITIYYTMNYTLLSDSIKKPIKEPKWKNQNEEFLFKDFKSLSLPKFAIELEDKPLDEKRIVIKWRFQVVKRFDSVLEGSITTKGVEYSTKGKKPKVLFDVDFLVKLFEKSGVKENTIIRCDIDYPVD